MTDKPTREADEHYETGSYKKGREPWGAPKDPSAPPYMERRIRELEGRLEAKEFECETLENRRQQAKARIKELEAALREKGPDPILRLLEAAEDRIKELEEQSSRKLIKAASNRIKELEAEHLSAAEAWSRIYNAEGRVKELEEENACLNDTCNGNRLQANLWRERADRLEGLIVEFIPRLDGFSFGQDIVKRAKAALYDK